MWAWRAGVSLIAVAPLLVCLAVAVRSFCAVGASTGTESATTERDLSSAATSAAWRSAAVTAIFPATLESIGDSGYRRLGVARLAGCGVLPAALRDRLAAAHCVAVLRATYVDTTRTAIATIGVVVLDGPSAARAALARAWPGTAADDDSALMPGVVPVPGTTAAGFENASRVGWHAVITQRGTYLCYAVTGFADGRRGSTAAQLRSGAWRTAQSPPGQAAEDLPATIGAELDAAVDTLGGRP